MDFPSFVIIITSVCLALYLYVQKKYAYWSNRGVPFIPPKFPFGNWVYLGKREHNSQLFTKLYKQKKGQGPLCGIYFFLNPVVLAIDIDLIRDIFIKDFQYFQDRGLYYNEKDDPLSAHLFNLEPVKWRILRSKLTPTFTSGKMKFMFPTIVDVADQFQLCLTKLIDSENGILEIRDLLGRFTTDIIGSCAFGIDCNSLKDPNAKFRQMGKKVFETPKSNAFYRIIMQALPNVARFLKFRSHHKDVTDFFMDVVKETIAYREQNNIERNDFMNLLIQLKNDGHLNDDPKNNVGQLTINEIAAQAYVFFLAGFETSATTLTYCLYELALNKDIQNKAREEINNVLKKCDGKLTYEALGQMVYIEHIINEALRKYPPGATIVRSVTKDYQVPGTNYTLAKKTMILLPVYAIHHDAEFYPEPEKFIPERFELDEVQKRPSCTFLPFGEGPRNCIGLRFGLLQARIGLVTLIKSFEFSTCPKTSIPIQFSSRNLVLSPVDGIWLKVAPIV